MFGATGCLVFFSSNNKLECLSCCWMHVYLLFLLEKASCFHVALSFSCDPIVHKLEQTVDNLMQKVIIAVSPPATSEYIFGLFALSFAFSVHFLIYIKTPQWWSLCEAWAKNMRITVIPLVIILWKPEYEYQICKANYKLFITFKQMIISRQ